MSAVHVTVKESSELVLVGGAIRSPFLHEISPSRVVFCRWSRSVRAHSVPITGASRLQFQREFAEQRGSDETISSVPRRRTTKAHSKLTSCQFVAAPSLPSSPANGLSGQR